MLKHLLGNSSSEVNLKAVTKSRVQPRTGRQEGSSTTRCLLYLSLPFFAKLNCHCCFQEIYLLVFLYFSVNLRIDIVKNYPQNKKRKQFQKQCQNKELGKIMFWNRQKETFLLLCKQFTLSQRLYIRMWRLFN